MTGGGIDLGRRGFLRGRFGSKPEAEACPEPVLDREAPAFQPVAVIGAACFATRGIVCQSCGDVCPEMAIRFRPRLGGPALPELAGDRCTGCGACVAVCPASAIGTPHRSEVDHA